jgi:hypothetical protein
MIILDPVYVKKTSTLVGDKEVSSVVTDTLRVVWFGVNLVDGSINATIARGSYINGTWVDAEPPVTISVSADGGFRDTSGQYSGMLEAKSEAQFITILKQMLDQFILTSGVVTGKIA